MFKNPMLIIITLFLRVVMASSVVSYLWQIFPGDSGLPAGGAAGLRCAVVGMLIGWTLYRSAARLL